jgi:membrane protein
MAASLAFYALFSLLPLALVALAILGFFLGDDPSSRGRLIDSLAGVLSAQSRIVLDASLANLQSHEGARGLSAVVGMGTLVFGASGVFSELETSLNTIWRVPPPPASGLWIAVWRALRDKASSFATVAGAGAILFVSLLVSTGLKSLSPLPGQTLPDALAWRVVNEIVSLGFATLLFATVFRMLPRTTVTWRDVRGGAFATAVLFGALRYLLAWYLGSIGSYAAYGAIGAVLALLMWIYVVALVVFFGAEITRVYAERARAAPSGSRDPPRAPLPSRGSPRGADGSSGPCRPGSE